MMRMLGQAAAQALDVELMKSPGFSIDQLMELAGLAVACAIASEYKPTGRILTVVGPGNNGGDGLVAARHLSHFGYDVHVLYPKEPTKPLFQNLVAQLHDLDVPVEAQIESMRGYDLIVDGIFGFSFDSSGGIREPYHGIIQSMIKSGVPIASIDIPSGWDVEKGDSADVGIEPEMLISLTVPKQCAKFFKGKYHYVGGRFLPPRLAAKYDIEAPVYPGASQCVKVTYEAEACE